MRLPGPLGGAQRVADLLVQSPRDDARHHLALARRERGVAPLDLRQMQQTFLALDIALEGDTDRLEHQQGGQGLGEESERAVAYRANGARDVDVAGQEDHGMRILARGERRLQVEPVGARHAQVHDEACGRVGILGGEVFRSRCIEARPMSCGGEHAPDGRAERAIVVDDVHDPRHRDGRTHEPIAGSHTPKTPPRGTLGSNHTRPRCISTMERTMDRPNPMLSFLVVNVDSKRRPASSGLKPGPSSVTAIPTPLETAQVSSRTSRPMPARWATASMAFTTRLITTCCSCTESPSTAGILDP